jgi:hypothetical protein
MTPEELKRNAAILEIWILIAIGIYYIQKKLVDNYIEAAKENITETRRNPFMIFLGGSVGLSGVSTFNNIIGEKITAIFKEFLSFLTPIFNMFSGIFKHFQDSINGIRNILSPMRDFFKTSAYIFYNQIQNFTIGIMYSLHKIRDTMKRTLSGFNLLFHTLEHSKNTIQSIVNSPPVDFAFSAIGKVDWLYGKARRFNFCFDGDTMLEMNDGKFKAIKDVVLGDVLKNNNTVIGTQLFINNSRLYDYNQVLVSGSHLVSEYENKTCVWRRVDETFSASLTNKTPLLVYCLTTKLKIIQINNIIFRDYSESNDKYINMNINKLILEDLNKNTTRDFSPYPSKIIEHGFHENSLVCLKDGQMKYIKDINMMDKINIKDYINSSFMNYVIGKVELLPEYFDLYEHNGIIVSSNTKILEKNIWINVENSKVFNKLKNNDIENKPNKIINIITENGTINILDNKGIENLFRDYLETHDEKTIKNIENLVKKCL